MAVSRDYLEYVLEQLAGLGRVHPRRMFGAVGVYCDERFFGILSKDSLYLKVDDSNRNDYEDRGMGPFRPLRNKPGFQMSYYEVPAEVLEDADELIVWARRSIVVAAATNETSRKKRGAGR